MNIDNVIMEITTIRNSMSGILADSHVLSSVLADLETQKKAATQLPKRAKKPPWTVNIPPSRPLVFTGTDFEPLVKHKLSVDLACSLSEPGEDGVPRGAHNVAVRVWSTEPSLCFREHLDAESVREHIQKHGRRVMLRFHFDFAERGQEGPKHHLQIGGKGMPDDHHWFPDNWKVPRFLHTPMNLALACEFIGRTFYPGKFSTISQEPTWTSAVRKAEEAYLFPFLRSLPYVAIEPKRRTKSLLSAVWNA